MGEKGRSKHALQSSGPGRQKARKRIRRDGCDTRVRNWQEISVGSSKQQLIWVST